jgi:ketosteroid isomerase-like protein
VRGALLRYLVDCHTGWFTKLGNDMNTTDAIQQLKAAFAAISSNDIGVLAQHFSKDASFFSARNPYRIDDLETFYRASESFFRSCGKIVNTDIRQPRVESEGDFTVVTFHFAERMELSGVSVGYNGRGTAVFKTVGASTLITHLHMTANEDTRGIMPTAGVSAMDAIASVEQTGAPSRRALGAMMWGCE